MIIIFGSLYFHQIFTTNDENENHSNASHVTYPYGGSGANQAFCAARQGAKIALAGSVGDDLDGKRIVNRLKRQGVMTSGVAMRSDIHTGALTIIHRPNEQTETIRSPGANTISANDQIPDEIMTPRNIIMVQDDLNTDESFTLLKRAKAHETFTIYARHHETSPLPDINDCNVIFTRKDHTVVCLANNEENIIDIKNNDVWVFDAFCGTFAAVYHAVWNMDLAINYAIAAAECAKTNNTIHGYYADTIEEMYKNMFKSEESDEN